jgi:acyl carrier protein
MFRSGQLPDVSMSGLRHQEPITSHETGRSMMKSCHIVEASGELLHVIADMIRTVSAKAKQAEIVSESLLLEELALDSLDLVRVIMLIEDRYHVAIDLDEVPKMKRVEDLARILSRELRSAA